MTEIKRKLKRKCDACEDDSRIIKRNKADYEASGKTPEIRKQLRVHYRNMTTPSMIAKYYKENKGRLSRDEIKKWLVWERMDLKIIPVIRELYAKGHRTANSCSGHKDHGGYISFNNKLSIVQIWDVKEVLKRYRAGNIRFSSEGKGTRVVFSKL